tara:strand:- start:112 stop:315 length:204 start_codon:yes stop_codon:yes gene_type:complete
MKVGDLVSIKWNGHTDRGKERRVGVLVGLAPPIEMRGFEEWIVWNVFVTGGIRPVAQRYMEVINESR